MDSMSKILVKNLNESDKKLVDLRISLAKGKLLPDVILFLVVIFLTYDAGVTL